MIPRAMLLKRAEEKAEDSDYWPTVAKFLRETINTPVSQMTTKQRNWLSSIRADLEEPWE